MARTYIEKAEGLLEQAGILNQENSDRVHAHSNPKGLATALNLLFKAGILTPDRFDMVLNNIEPDKLASMLSTFPNLDSATISKMSENETEPLSIEQYLIDAGLDTLENKAIIEKTPLYNLHELQRALEDLNQFNLLSQQNFNLITANSPLKTSQIICSLHIAGIMNPENLVRALAYPEINPETFISLHQSGLLTPENLKKVQLSIRLFASRSIHLSFSFVKAIYYSNLYKVLDQRQLDMMLNSRDYDFDYNKFIRLLGDEDILTSENLEILQELKDLNVFNTLNPNTLNQILEMMQDSNILNQESFNTLLAPQLRDPNVFGSLNNILYMMQDNNILNEESFNTLLSPQNAILLSNEAFVEIWDRLPPHELNMQRWTEIINTARQAHPLQRLRRLVDNILGIEEREPIRVEINPAQSTHTASVHQSVSNSAIRLKKSYESELSHNLDTILGKLKTMIDELPDSEKKRVGKRCLTRIIEQGATFIDPDSQISTNQLLALAYLAIHDDHKRLGTLDDAKKQFLEALYEIQRGYNLSESNQDQGGNDRPICAGGTFNKLIERLTGTHPDVEFLYITSNQAGVKLPIVVKEEALSYLSSLASPKTAPEFLAFTQLLSLCQTEGIEPIWDKIKEKVEQRIFDEFGSLYKNPKDSNFLALISTGIDTEIGDLKGFQKQLSESEGYKKFLSQMLRQESIFNTKPEEASTQREKPTKKK